MQQALDHMVKYGSLAHPAQGCGQLDLNGFMEKIERGHTSSGVESLVSQLSQLRSRTNTDEWRRFIAEEARVHPIKTLLHTDPFTRHAYSKPRGYPGDAKLLDYIYAPATLPTDDTVGAKISAYTLPMPTRCDRQPY